MSDGDNRLPTSLWVDAHLKQCEIKGLFFYITNKGAPYSGTVLVKLNGQGNGFRILSQIRDLDGQLAWMHALGKEDVEEAEIDAYIRRSIERDPDIWVIEIEDRELNNPFEGKIIE